MPPRFDIRISLTLIALAPLPAIAQTTAPANAPAPAPATDNAAPEDEIVVTAQRDRGDVIGRAVPDVRIGQDEIASYGASDVGELLQTLAPQTGEGPVVLVNGRRISGLAEITRLPPEAVERVDILPEETALAYGYRADQRVVNIVLKNQFGAITANVRTRLPFAGGRSENEASLSYVKINPSGRLGIDLSYGWNSALYESERSLVSRSAGGYFDPLGNITAAVPGSEIDPGLSALAGSPVLVAGVPEGASAPTLAGFAALAGDPNQSDVRRYRTLMPSQRNFQGGVSFNRKLSSDIQATFTARYALNDGTSVVGLPSLLLSVPGANPFSPFTNDVLLYAAPDALGPLRAQQHREETQLRVVFNGTFSKWNWFATLSRTEAKSRARTDAGYDAAPLQTLLDSGSLSFNPFAPIAAGELTRLPQTVSTSANRDTSAEFVLTGPVARLPAGDVRATLRGTLASHVVESSLTQNGVRQDRDLSNTESEGSINLTLPIASRREGVLAGLGDLSVNLMGSYQHISGLGGAERLGAGASWAPTPSLRLSATLSRSQSLPPAAQRGDPVIVTPNVPVLDFVTGDNVLVTRIDGGNPLLRAPRSSTFSASGRWKPLGSRNVTLNLAYNATRTTDLVGTVPTATPQVEAAFPDRFQRDPAGRLTQIDARPVNFDRSEQRQLSWGGFFSLPLSSAPPVRGRRFARPSGGEGTTETEDGDAVAAMGGDAPVPPGMGSRLVISLNHVIRLEDTVLIRAGLPVLDRLSGEGLGGLGASRHQINARVNYRQAGIGATAEARWQSAARLTGGATDLRFSAFGTINLRLFADLGQVGGLARAAPWLSGTRLTLDFENVFDSHSDVRDQNGATPLAYQPAYLDPFGRAVRIGLRKQF